MKITQSQLRQMIQEELELNRQLQSITRKQGKRASAIAITLKYLRTLLPLLPGETQSEVSLIAIGIGHDVTRYYKNAVTIHRAEELGGAMLEQLTDLFKVD